jgi:hypothetical protein
MRQGVETEGTVQIATTYPLRSVAHASNGTVKSVRLHWVLRLFVWGIMGCVALPLLFTAMQPTPVSARHTAPLPIVPPSVVGSVWRPSLPAMSSTHVPLLHGATGLGAGAVTIHPYAIHAVTETSGCSIFSNPTCWVEQTIQQAIAQVAQWLAGGLMSVITPLVKQVDASQDNVITSTPICVFNLTGCQVGGAKSLDGALLTFMQWATWGVDGLALVLLLIIVGYNVMLGNQLGLAVFGVAESLPRVALAMLAAALSPMIVQVFIDLNNALCLGALETGLYGSLTNIIIGLIQTGLTDGFLIWLFILALLVLNLLVAWQMIVRLAFLAFLCAMAPLGLLCLALPQTLAWGRLWLSNFTITVFVQFLQVALLALGGMMASSVIALSSSLFGNLPTGKIILTIMLTIALFLLVLRLPGMLRTWALSGVSNQAGQAIPQAAGAVASVAPRLLALALA